MKDTRSLRERIERQVWRVLKPRMQRREDPLPRRFAFIAGVQRSGTNMLMEMLDWSRWTDVYHESDPRAFERYEMRPRTVIRSLADKSSAPFFVIKSLCELDELPSLMNQFAPARTVWIVRSLDDCVNSAVRSFGDFASQLHRLAKDKQGAAWRGHGMSDETQSVLRKFDSKDINEASAAALMWYYRNVLFFEKQLDRDERVALVSYENLVDDPGAVSHEIFRFLGIPDWSPWIYRYVHANSVRNTLTAPIEPEIRKVCAALHARFSQIVSLNRSASE